MTTMTTTRRRPTAQTAPGGPPLGWIVVHRVDGHWLADGYVHTTRQAAEAALKIAVAAGQRSVLTAAHWTPVTTPVSS